MPGDVHVVAPDNGHVLGDPTPRTGDTVQRTQSDKVVRADKPIGPDGLSHFEPAVRGQFAPKHPTRRTEGKPVTPYRSRIVVEVEGPATKTSRRRPSAKRCSVAMRPTATL
jgi:hypothetical protein